MAPVPVRILPAMVVRMVVVVAVRVVATVRVAVLMTVSVDMLIAAGAVLRMMVPPLRLRVGRLAVDHHAELGRTNPAPVHALATDANSVQPERLHGFLQHFERHAGIEERAGDHVAGRSGEAV